MSDSSPTPHGTHASGSHYQPSLSVVLIIVVLFVGSTFLMVRAVSPSTVSATIPTSSPSTPTTSLVLTKSTVRVQVANGTNTTGLAASITQRLMLQGWNTLPPGNGPHVAATIIYYNPNYHRAALEIASTIRVSSSAVRPLNGANPITGSSSDDVIVVLGPNSAIS